MKSYLRILCAAVIGLVLTAPLFNGGKSINPLATPAYAQLTDTEFTNLIEKIEDLSSGKDLIDNINPIVFKDLGRLTNTDLSNLISLDLNSIASYPGLSDTVLGVLQDLPNDALDNLLTLDISDFENLGNLTENVLDQVDDFLDLADNLSEDVTTIINQFDSILGGDISDLLNTTDLFSNFDVSSLDSIAGNLGLDFGDFVGDLTDSLNIDIDNFIDFDFSELSSLGISDLGDLIGDLGLNTSVLNGLATDLGSTVTDLLNIDLSDLDSLGIGGIGDMSDLVNLDVDDLLDDLTSSLGVNVSDFLGDFTNIVDLDLNSVLDFDFSDLSSLGIDNLGDVSSLLGVDVNSLLGDLSSTLGIDVSDLANLDLSTLTDTLNLDSIADISNILNGLDANGLINGLSSALGVDITDFADIGLDALSNLGLDNVLDLAKKLNLDLGDLTNLTGLDLDDLLSLDISDLSGLLGGIDSLGDLTSLIGGDLGGAISSLAGSLGLSGTLTIGGISVSFSPGTGSSVSFGSIGFGCNSVYGLGCCNEPECLCSGWCYPSPPTCPSCFQGAACTWCLSSCDFIPDVHEDDTRPFWDVEMWELERWQVQDFFAGYILPSMMAMAEELTDVAMLQVVAIGGFFDAKMELETHRLLQEFHAQAHKDYHPSEGVCVFATNVRGLAMTQRKLDLTHSIMSTRAIDRHLGIENDNAAIDVQHDLGEQFTSPADGNKYRSGRLRQFQDTYCNPRDNNEKLKFLCGNGGAGAPDADRVNTDIDFYENFASKRTLPFDFTKTEFETSNDEREELYDYIAMTKNLYGHKIPYRPPVSNFDTKSGALESQDNLTNNPFVKYLNLRSMTAKRSVAENSFHAQTALKSQGDGSAAGYMNSILSELGLKGDAVIEFMNGGASYYSQMEILTKKIYQNPDFYINLYDKPANVKRKLVALKAIGIMQEWDTLEVKLRTEMLAAILLELGLKQEQERIQNRLK